MPLKPGMMEWHTSECDMLYSHTVMSNGSKAYWCHTHTQWAYESPVTVQFIYADGSREEKAYR